jgi:hypothetical protein
MNSTSAWIQTNEFAQTFGFLSTKMKTEFYWWEVLISMRKLLLVAAVKFSDGQRLPCALMNLFVAVAAFGAQVYVLPFANGDANIAESLTLLATILVLILGMAQKEVAAEQLAGATSTAEQETADGFISVLNVVIYILMFSMVGASLFIVLRRLKGAYFNCRHLKQLNDAEKDGRVIHNDVRTMLHREFQIFNYHLVLPQH